MPSKYGTLGAHIADQYHQGRRGDEIEMPSDEEMKRMPMNRADARLHAKMLPRALRIEMFGKHKRRVR